LLINGKEQDVSVIRLREQYPLVRNMVLLSGHFMTKTMCSSVTRCDANEKLALKLVWQHLGQRSPDCSSFTDCSSP